MGARAYEPDMERLVDGMPPRLALAALLVTALGGCGNGEGTPPRWRLLTAELDGALLSVHARAEDEVYFAGGAMLTGGQALALRYDGQRVEALRGAEGVDTLWWACSAPGGPVWFVGEGGAIFRLEPGGSELRPVDSPVEVTLYGCWAPEPGQAWAVGGDVRGDGDKDVVLRYEGDTWRRVPLPDPQGVTLFKVWGSGGQVFVVGERATILRFDGTSWTPETVEGGGGRLLTVHAAGERIWAVGGGGPGAVVLRRGEDGVWHREELPDLASDLNGVAVAPQGTVLAVGSRLTGWMREEEGAWSDLSETFYELASGAITTRAPVDLHGAAWSPDGTEAYAVGGTLLPVPGQPLQGVILHYGGEARPWNPTER